LNVHVLQLEKSKADGSCRPVKSTQQSSIQKGSLHSALYLTCREIVE